jgi:hypothetical protein
MLERNPLPILVVSVIGLMLVVWFMPGDKPAFVTTLAHASLGPCQ